MIMFTNSDASSNIDLHLLIDNRTSKELNTMYWGVAAAADDDDDDDDDDDNDDGNLAAASGLVIDDDVDDCNPTDIK